MTHWTPGELAEATRQAVNSKLPGEDEMHMSLLVRMHKAQRWLKREGAKSHDNLDHSEIVSGLVDSEIGRLKKELKGML